MIKINGLLPLKRDDRDFNLAGVFGSIKIEGVPNEDFSVCNIPPLIKDQGESDLCTAYATTSASEDQEGIVLSPEFQFYATKVLLGGNKEEWGADLRDACKSLVKIGSIPSLLYKNVIGQSRDFILDSKNWDSKVLEYASLHKKRTYFSVQGNYDTFDNIRCALWQHKDDNTSIVTGALWRNAWTYAPNGIIPSTYETDGFGHAFKLFGQKIINGEPYLIAQLSNGENIGDKGFFYFPRDVVNKEIGGYGLFMFKDISREEAERYLNSTYTKQTPFYMVIITNIIDIIKKFIWKQ